MILTSNNIYEGQDKNRLYKIVRYSSELANDWDEFVYNSLSGTFLHTRKFLSYHGNKFDDQSLMLYDNKDTLRAVFPAARDPSNETIVISHPGITYGGLIQDGWLYGDRCLAALKQACAHYALAGLKELIYKAVPLIYHHMPAQDDIYSLFRLGADRYRIDLSATINLEHRGKISNRRTRSKQKAHNEELTISYAYNLLPDYWKILAKNLEGKYGKKPVHSIEELFILKEKFPTEIELITCSDKNEILAGTVLFFCPTLVHAQYFASTSIGKEKGALDLVIEHAIEKALQAGKKLFDFGISTDEQGQYLNAGLHTYKCEFGACGVVYEFFRLKLESLSDSMPIVT